MADVGGSRLRLRFPLLLGAALLFATACPDRGQLQVSDASATVDGALACPSDCAVFCADSGRYPGNCPCSCPATTARCPSAAPSLFATCPALGLSCTYGDSPRPSCRTIMGCGGAQQCNCGSDVCPPSSCFTPEVWVGGGPGSGVGLTDRCSWTCPATPPSVGQPCTPPGYCAQPDGTQCGCIGLDSQGGSVWTCLPPPSDPRCPLVAPLIGSACTDEGLACGNYDICVTGSRVLCTRGSWADDFGTCPN
jgi:hypothetical protein